MTQYPAGNFSKYLIDRGIEPADLYRGEYQGGHPETVDPEAFRSEPAKSSCCSKNVGDAERALSLAAGAALGVIGLSRGGLSGLALTAIGGGLIYRGYTGHCSAYSALGVSTAEDAYRHTAAVPAQYGYKVEKSIVVEKSPVELYRFWRRFENLPRVMRHLKLVETQDELRSHWKAEGALGKDLEWDAEIINERENEMIAWQSLPGGDIDTAGSVRFEPMDHNRGTKVTVSMKYNPPAGKLGAHVASLVGEGLDAKLEEDLQTFKDVMETGMEAAPATA
jgi:uncharacterized membrane protein